jgi:hypothetical protein
LRNISTAGDDRAVDLLLHADDLHGLADLDDPALDAAGGDGAPARDREHVLDRHQERLVDVALRHRHVVVDRGHQLEDPRLGVGVAVEGVEGGNPNHRDVVARELVAGQELPNLELDELEQLLVVDHVGLVQRDDDVGDAHLAGEQDVLAGLRHGAVGGRHDEDRAVHLRGTGDHVLDVVRVTGAVDVGVMAVLGLVLDVRGRDRDAALALLGGVVDRVERPDLAAAELLGEDLGDGGGEGRLAVIDVADRADVHMWLRPVELLFRHLRCSCSSRFGRGRWRRPAVRLRESDDARS